MTARTQSIGRPFVLRVLARGVVLARERRWSRRQVEERQRRRFTSFLRYVRAHSPFYAEVMRERGLEPESARPTDFPVLTKADFVRHFDRIVTRPGLNRARLEAFLLRSRDPNELLDGRYVVVHTSGSSGVVGYCAYTLAEWIDGWSRFFHLVPKRGRLPRRTAFVGVIDGHYAAVSLAVTARWAGLGLVSRAELIDCNQPTRAIIDSLNRCRPHYLSCYGSFLGELVAARQRGSLAIRPAAIITGADPLPESDRARAEQVFGVPVLDIYACTESMIIGMRGPDTQGLVLFEEDLWVECEAGRVLVTSMLNRTTPLIRYEIPDILSPAVPESYRLYPGYRRAGSLAGRRENRLSLVNEHGEEDSIHPFTIIEFFVPGLDRFQAVRTGPAEVLFRVKPAAGLSPDAVAALLLATRRRWDDILASRQMRNVRLSVELVDSLPSDPRTGKFRIVDSRWPPAEAPRREDPAPE